MIIDIIMFPPPTEVRLWDLESSVCVAVLKDCCPGCEHMSGFGFRFFGVGFRV